MIWVLRAALIWLLVLILPANWLHKHGLMITSELTASRMASFGGEAFSDRLAVPPFFQAVPDTLENTAVSRLRLFENAKRLGPPHTSHAEIRADGHGRFSHWYGTVVFSSSDGSNPITNGRNYWARYPVHLTPWGAVIGFAGPAVLLAMARILYALRARLRIAGT